MTVYQVMEMLAIDLFYAAADCRDGAASELLRRIAAALFAIVGAGRPGE